MKRSVTKTVVLRFYVVIIGLAGLLVGSMSVGLGMALPSASLAVVNADEDSVLQTNKAFEKALQMGYKA